MPATFAVLNTNDSGADSFRQAILDSNSTPGADVITFAIPGAGVQTINVGISTSLPLPAIIDEVTIDGRTQPGYAGTPLIEINGSTLQSGSGLVIDDGNLSGIGSSIIALSIFSFTGDGVEITGDSFSSVTASYLGVRADGTTAPGNGLDGVFVTTANNTIGGTTPADRNVISGNGFSGGTCTGVALSGSGANDNLVQGNFIGTDVTGTLDRGNVGDGVTVNFGASRNVIGGPTAGARNVISGNDGNGVGLDSAGLGNVVQGNFIGGNATDTANLGNDFGGVSVFGTNSATIRDNVIRGNFEDGVDLFGGGGGHQVVSNFIGFNTFDGVYVSSSNNNVTSNNVSGNGGDGVEVGSGSSGNLVGFNFIGSNGEDGIEANGGTATTIRGNTIGGNVRNGVEISTSATGTAVVGNFIGTDSAGANLANGLDGVRISANANAVGGPNAGDGNVITNNNGNGVTVVSGVNNAISQNSIFSNVLLGIDLGNNGVTPNDPGDADLGANNLQNAPVLIGAALSSPTQFSVAGTLDSVANESFVIEYFASNAIDPSGFGEGMTFLGAQTVTTDATGTVTFFSPTLTNPAPVNGGTVITATARRVTTQDTSEFSNGVALVVINTNDAGYGSLRQAILSANLIPGANLILFAIPNTDPGFNSPTGTWTITPLSELPGVTEQATIDAFSQGGPSYAGPPLIELNGTNAGTAADGLTLTSANNVVRGFVINRFNGNGIMVDGMAATGNRITGNYVGTDVTGTMPRGNAGAGILVIGSAANNTIGGLTPLERNVISSTRLLVPGQGAEGIEFTGAGAGNVAVGNYVGTDVTGTQNLGNQGAGILVDSTPNVTIRSNVIANSGGSGVAIQDGSTNTTVATNLIGTNAAFDPTPSLPTSGDEIAAGTRDLGNGLHGVRVFDSAGLTTITGNVISGNAQDGVLFNGAVGTTNRVQGNFIGTNAAGNAVMVGGADLGNTGAGVRVQNTPRVIIGVDDQDGTPDATEGNVIGGNAVGVSLESNGSVVAGNFIGTNAAGVNLGNRSDGVFVNAANALIGTDGDGTSDALERNVISLNAAHGVNLNGASNALITGNFIGTNAAGNALLGNGADGVFANAGATVTVGGATAALRNLISGNGRDGVRLEAAGTSNVVQGNFVGTDAAGVADLGNGGNGVSVLGTTSTSVLANLISGNGRNGLEIFSNSGMVFGNTIGLDVGRTSALANGGSGIVVGPGALGNTIGTLTPGGGNVVSGNAGNGVQLDGGDNTLQGNLIGVNGAGTAAIANGGHGVVLLGLSNRVLGAPGARQVISGNALIGVFVLGSSGTVAGNFIGLGLDGNTAIPNGGEGVFVATGAIANSIGLAGAGNVISGNGGDGVQIDGNSNTLVANRIGTNAAGTAAVGNGGDGVFLSLGATANSISAPSAADRNVISGNGGDGVQIDGNGNAVRGAFIGLNAAGTAGLGNRGNGVVLLGNNNQATAATGVPQVVSDNTLDGIQVAGTNNLLTGNVIGTSADGTVPIPNGRLPINMLNGANQVAGNVGARGDVGGVALSPEQAFVSRAFLDLLGRTVDPTGLATFTAMLSQGGSTDDVLTGITNSVEYRSRVVEELYQRFLRRSADPAGLMGFVAQLNAGASVASVRASIVGSDEYFITQGGGTTTGFLTALYRDGLGRPIDPTGLADFSAKLAAGVSRAAVADQVFRSPEARQNRVQELFQLLLDRAADPVGLNAFTTALANGATEEQLIAGIAGSAEYASQG